MVSRRGVLWWGLLLPSCTFLYDHSSLLYPNGPASDASVLDGNTDINLVDTKADGGLCDNLSPGSFCLDFNSGSVPSDWQFQTTAGSEIKFAAKSGPDGTTALRTVSTNTPAGSTANIRRHFDGPVNHMVFAADHYMDAPALPNSSVGTTLLRIELQPLLGEGWVAIWVKQSGELALAIADLRSQEFGMQMPLRKWVRFALDVNLVERTVKAFVDDELKAQIGLDPIVTSTEYYLSLGAPYARNTTDSFSVLVDNARFEIR